MSAYLCSAYHVGRIAALIASESGKYVKYHVDVPQDTKLGAEMAALIASKLATSNVASIQERYPDTVDDFAGSPGVISECKDGPVGYIAACAQAARAPFVLSRIAPLNFAWAVMVKACDCFGYQACEYDGWKESDGYKLNEIAKSIATAKLCDRALVGYDGHAWDLQAAS